MSAIEVREWPGKPVKGRKTALPDMVSVRTGTHVVLICEHPLCGVVWETRSILADPGELEENVRVHAKHHRARRVRKGFEETI